MERYGAASSAFERLSDHYETADVAPQKSPLGQNAPMPAMVESYATSRGVP